MDTHHKVDGLTAEAVAAAQAKDLFVAELYTSDHNTHFDIISCRKIQALIVVLIGIYCFIWPIML